MKTVRLATLGNPTISYVQRIAKSTYRSFMSFPWVQPEKHYTRKIPTLSPSGTRPSSVQALDG